MGPIAASIGVAVVLLVAVGNLTVSLPVFGWLSGVQVPLAVMLPVIPVLAVTTGLANTDPQLEGTAVRPVALLDLGLVVTTTTAMAVLCCATQALGLSFLGAAAARNTVGFAGMMLLVMPAGASLAALAPVLFLVIVAGFGSSGTGIPEWWAWPVAPESSASALTIAASLGVAGTLVATRTKASRGWDLAERPRE